MPIPALSALQYDGWAGLRSGSAGFIVFGRIRL